MLWDDAEDMFTDTDVRDALREVIDPELGINIVDLGLVYRIEIENARVRVVMTMTSRACPLGEYLRDLVDSTIRWRVRDAQDVEVVLVWNPPWNADMMSDEARQQLGGGEG
jgi:metal-sulfur cluster biosynthetic enzyme